MTVGTRRRVVAGVLTDWDVLVLFAIALSLIGWFVTIWMGFDPSSRTWEGFAAAGSCQVWALITLIAAFRM